VKEILECDMKTEQMAMPVLRDAIEHCAKVRDYGSRDLFYKILHNEEHVDYIETQMELDRTDRHPELYPAAIEAEREPGAGIGGGQHTLCFGRQPSACSA